MGESDGPTQREFDREIGRLDSRLGEVERHGSPAVKNLAIRLENLHSEMLSQGRRIDGLVRVAIGILMALLAGLVTLITALALEVF